LPQEGEAVDTPKPPPDPYLVEPMKVSPEGITFCARGSRHPVVVWLIMALAVAGIFGLLGVGAENVMWRIVSYAVLGFGILVFAAMAFHVKIAREQVIAGPDGITVRRKGLWGTCEQTIIGRPEAVSQLVDQFPQKGNPDNFSYIVVERGNQRAVLGRNLNHTTLVWLEVELKRLWGIDS
jgi:hypothetical protein